MTGKHQIVAKPWPNESVECGGDYRDEMYLESLIGGPLYEFQSKMPRLPIPSTKDTIKRFLGTALPLARTEEEKFNLVAACEAFPDQAEIFHKRLVERRDKEFKESSWLQKWWNQGGYLAVRDPVVVNVSYFFSFVDDPTVDVSTSSNPMIQRGAAMLFATAEFRKLVITGQLPYEKVGRKKIPICATAYKYMFNACRIPQRQQDTYKIYDPSRYQHCIVSRKGHFFSIQLVDKYSGNPLPLKSLEAQLQQCISLADAIPSSRPKLGLMTAMDRDSWADFRQKIINEGGISAMDAFEKLQSGAILLCLDDEMPVSRQELGDQFWTGGLKSGENRWFDKSIQLMVTSNGKAGFLGEHSMMDGMPLINFCNYVTKVTYAQARRKSINLEHSPGEVEDIFGKSVGSVNKQYMDKMEAEAWNSFHKLITSHVLHAQSFQGYGSSFIKKSGFAPDAFVQVAMQLATYRLFGEQVGTYEATQVRSFLHGRTEVSRGVSLESEAFVKKMTLRPKQDEHVVAARKEKLALLKKAVSRHAAYTGLAAKAQGVDRHFTGLSMLVKEGEKAPSLFSDPVFIRSKRWRVSTSQLSHPRFNLWGYGEVVPDGVGLAYAILPNSCVFNITALRSTGWTDKLSELLEEALIEMRRLIESDRPPNSKL